MKEADWKRTKTVNSTGRKGDYETVQLIAKDALKKILTELDKRRLKK